MIFYVNKAGTVDFRRPVPKLILGPAGAIIAGFTVKGFVSLAAAKIISELVWSTNQSRYQQFQIGSLK